jgi:hypothetical protein
MAYHSELTRWLFSVHNIIIVVAIAGALLGVYAACKDIADKWSTCDYKIQF